MTVVYSAEEVKDIVTTIKENPNWFLGLVNACCDEKVKFDTLRSMRAWGIPIPKHYEKNTSNRSARSRQDNQD